MDVVGLRGQRCRLVPPDPADHLENALRWMNDPDVTACLEQVLGVTRRQEEQFFERITSPSDDQLHWAIVTEDLGHVGFIALQTIQWRHRAAVGGIVLGERRAWGRGIATDAVSTRTRFAFDQLGLHRVEGHTIHPAMRRVYEKAGYQYEGASRLAVWRNGAWRDAHRYAVLDVDFYARFGFPDETRPAT